jgi:hypothetical protein
MTAASLSSLFSAKKILWLMIPFCLLLVAVSVRIVNSAKVSTSGTQSWSLIHELSVLKEERDVLEQELAALTSLASLSIKAKELGFVEQRSVIRVGTKDTSLAFSAPNL